MDSLVYAGVDTNTMTRVLVDRANKIKGRKTPIPNSLTRRMTGLTVRVGPLFKAECHAWRTHRHINGIVLSLSGWGGC